MLVRLTIFLVFVSFGLAQHCSADGIYNAKYNRCYKYFSTPAEYLYAEQLCTNLGGHLASISDGQENLLINTNAVQAFHSSYTDYWIGANDLSNPGQWQWTDGANFAYTSWGASQPQSGNDCVTQQLADAKWATVSCSEQRPYVCVTASLDVPTCPTPPPQPVVTCPTIPLATQKACAASCEIEWSYFPPTDMCYKTFFNAKWDDAEAFCVSQSAHLVSIHTSLENTFINNIARMGIKEGHIQDLTWIGLSKNGSEWVWTDGTKTDYLNWAPKQPDNPGKENCVETAPDRSHDGWYENWNNAECSTLMRSYVCKKPSIH
ncbi:unnamed protein product [Caenorhabditis auriculariae]|uniref:C-type lectin domain-containing protein n=1 Tax=Caenorhabditis auriculariae TaxID=2777116 RepID=A0A8S1H376_9PELO|nr:unnamed protein product [Caenorhabditis auriculariae]